MSGDLDMPQATFSDSANSVSGDLRKMFTGMRRNAATLAIFSASSGMPAFSHFSTVRGCFGRPGVEAQP